MTHKALPSHVRIIAKHAPADLLLAIDEDPTGILLPQDEVDRHQLVEIRDRLADGWHQQRSVSAAIDPTINVPQPRPLALVSWMIDRIDEVATKEVEEPPNKDVPPPLQFDHWQTQYGQAQLVKVPKSLRDDAHDLLRDIEHRKDDLGAETGAGNLLRPVLMAMRSNDLLYVHGGTHGGKIGGSIIAKRCERSLLRLMAICRTVILDATYSIRHHPATWSALIAHVAGEQSVDHRIIRVDQSAGVEVRWAVDGPVIAKESKAGYHYPEGTKLLTGMIQWAQERGLSAGILSHRAISKPLLDSLRGAEIDAVVAADPDESVEVIPAPVDDHIPPVIGWYGAHDRGVNVYEHCDIILIAGAYRPPTWTAVPDAALKRKLGIPAPTTMRSFDPSPGLYRRWQSQDFTPRRVTVGDHSRWYYPKPKQSLVSLTWAQVAPPDTDKAIAAEIAAMQTAHRIQLIGRARGVQRAADGRPPAVVVVVGLELPTAAGFHLSDCATAWTYAELKEAFSHGPMGPDELRAYCAESKAAGLSGRKALEKLKTTGRGVRRSVFRAAWNEAL